MAITSVEQSTMRKVTRRIIYFCFILWAVSYIDRVNVGFAALQMNKDLGFGSAVFGLGAGIFFLGYCLFEVPSNLILYRVGPRVWIGRIMITWGLVASAMALIHSPQTFYGLRLLLGIAEAGFLPGIILYITYWFPGAYRARAMSVFMSATVLSSVIGAPLSGLILSHMQGVAGLAAWQWMFVLEGIPAVLLGLAVYKVLVDKPENATWLTVEEKVWLQSALAAPANVPARHHEIQSVWRAFINPRVLLLGIVYFTLAVPVFGILLWLPQIVNGFGGLSVVEVGFISAIPFLVAAVAMIVVGYASDRTGNRRAYVAFWAAWGWSRARGRPTPICR